jgi:hypothetical protein
MAECLTAGSADLREAQRQIEAALCAMLADCPDGTVLHLAKVALSSCKHACRHLNMMWWRGDV